MFWVRFITFASLLLSNSRQLPHVSTLDSTRAFLGMVGNLREFSVIWEPKELGVTLKSAADVAGGRIGGGSGVMPAGDASTSGSPVVFSVQVRKMNTLRCKL